MVKNLVYTGKMMNADSVEGFREAFKRTRFTCEGDETLVLRLFERTLKHKKTMMSAAALSEWVLSVRLATTGLWHRTL